MAQAVETLEAFVGGKRLPLADAAAVVETAVAGLVASQAEAHALSSAERAAILDRIAATLAERADDLAAELAAEASFLTAKDMVGEIARTIDLAKLTAAATREGFDELVNLDASPRGRDALCTVRRVPIGPMLGITAFNGPILTGAHKLFPAIAAGVPTALKPSPWVPRAAVTLAELVVGAGWPAGALAALPVDNEMTMRLVHDERLPVISFTGGEVGWAIKDAVPRKHVHLELGGPGAVLVAADGDLEAAAAECVIGGFVRSGQACLSVQRIFVVREVHDELVAKLAAEVSKLAVAGRDPGDPDVGPLVSEAAADRVWEMLEDARERGAEVVVGGERDGAVITPTLLAGVTPEMAVMRREVFGPIIAVVAVDTLGEAIPEANSIDGMLQAGIFSRDIDLALTLADKLFTGTVVINGSNAWRIDSFPFGGVGKAGTGREGVRAMVREITTTKNVVIRHRPVAL